MKSIITILILFVFSQLSFSQWRETTQAERDFSKRVMEKLETIISPALKKMHHKWSYEFEERKKNTLEGPTEIDGSSVKNLPYEVRAHFRLYFENAEWEKLNFDERVNEYYQTVDSLTALGETEKIIEMTNPEHELEVYILVVVNNFILSGFQADDMYLERTPEKNEKFISVPGTVFSSVRKFPGSTNSPETVLSFGEIHYKGYQGKASYGAGRNFNSTDIKHIGIFISTSVRLAEEFYKNLEINAINNLITTF